MNRAELRALDARLALTEASTPSTDTAMVWPSWAEPLLADGDSTVRMRAALLVHRCLDRDGPPAAQLVEHRAAPGAAGALGAV